MTHIFDVIDARKEEYEYKVYASYMEIYNEKAYDLLNEDHLVSPLEQWSKVNPNAHKLLQKLKSFATKFDVSKLYLIRYSFD